MRHHVWVFVLAIGCGGNMSADDTGVPVGGTDSGSGSGGSGGGGADPGGQGGSPAPGQLTAGEFDDNLNPTVMEQELTTLFADQIAIGGLPLSGRVVATVHDGDGLPVANAMVDISDDSGTLASLPTGTDGRVLFMPTIDGFDGASNLRVSVSADGLTSTQQLPPTTQVSLVIPGSHGGSSRALDLGFVIDTTGSMGDELQYIQSEVENIATRVAADHPDVAIRYGLVLYRDLNDEYVTRTFPFTDNLAAFQNNLAAQSAAGGDDYPEAAERGMAAAIGLDWHSGNVARVLFHIADAPPHDNAYGLFLDQVRIARASNIRIYPVGASGVGIDAEYLMRQSAIATAARYLFLTDDSGIGNSHEVPHIPCYQVEHLNDLMVRMIDSELEGQYVRADPADVIRTVGTVLGDGVCGPPAALVRR
jgi:hypothetical protein